jgi:hypothetical protein
LELRDSYRQCLDGYLRLAETLTELIDELEETIMTIAQKNDQVMPLTTIPGVGYFSGC